MVARGTGTYTYDPNIQELWFTVDSSSGAINVNGVGGETIDTYRAPGLGSETAFGMRRIAVYLGYSGAGSLGAGQGEPLSSEWFGGLPMTMTTDSTGLSTDHRAAIADSPEQDRSYLFFVQ